MDDQNLGTRIREFLRGLFGSRVAEQMENELLRVRNDYETRLRERDELVAEQRSRIAALEGKLERYELVLIPLTSPLGSLLQPKPRPAPIELNTEPSSASSWQEYRNAWLAQQEQDSQAAPKEIQQ